MIWPWKRTRATVDPSDGANGTEVPERTEWHLTRCKQCGKVTWWGQPIPYVVTSKEPVEQLRRVNHGRGSSKRIPVTDLMRHVGGKPKQHQWRCSCGAAVDQCGVATEASHILALTLSAMRKAGAL